MKIYIPAILFLLLIICLPDRHLSAQVVTWTGAGDGTEWNDPLNWLPIMVPNATTPAVIATGSPRVTAAASALSLTIQGSATLTIDATFSFTTFLDIGGSAELIWTGGLISGLGPILNSGKLKVNQNGAQVLAGGFGIINEGEIHINNSTGVSINAGGIIDNNGLIVFLDSGDLLLNAGGDLNNNGNIDFAADDANIIGGAGELVNNGVISKTSGNGENDIDIFLDNTGHILQVLNGKIKLKDGGNLDNSTFLVNAGTAVELDGGTFELNGTLTANSAGTVKLNEASLSVPTTALLNFTGTGFQWSDGNITGGGTLNIPSGVNMLLSGNAQKDLIGPTTIANAGRISLTNSGNLFLVGDAVINNTNIFEFAADDCNLSRNSTNSEFLNTGIFRKTGGSGTNVVQLFFNNQNGIIECQSGKLSFTRGGTLTDGQYTASSGAELLFEEGNFGLSGTLTGTPSGIVGHNATLVVATTAALNFGGTGFQWQVGVINGGGTLTNLGFFYLTGPGAKDITNSTDIENVGTMSLKGGNITVYGDNWLLTNSGVFDFEDDSDIGSNFGTVNKRFINTASGIFRKSGGSDVSAHSAAIQFFNQNGTVEALSGTLELRSKDLDGGTYHAAAGANLHFNGTFTVSGTLGGSPIGNVVLLGTFSVPTVATLNFGGSGLQWRGTITGGGIITNANRLHLNGTTTKTLTGQTTLTNNSLMTLEGGNLIYFNDNVKIDNYAIFEILDDSDIGSSFGLSNKIFRNHAGSVLRKTGGTDVSLLSSAIQFKNLNAAVDVQSGTLELNGNELTDGTYAVAAGAVLDFKGTFIVTGTLTGTPNGAIFLSGSFSSPDPVNLNFSGTGLQWRAGSLTGGGTFTNTASFHLVNSTQKTITAESDIINNGMMTHSGNGSLVFYNNNVSVTNNGSFDIVDDSGFITSFGSFGKLFINAASGLLRKTGGSGTSTMPGQIRLFNQNGTVRVESGTLKFTGGGELNGGTYEVLPGATLDLQNNVFNFSDNFLISGILSGNPQGNLLFNGGNMIATASATLNFGGTGLQWNSGAFSGGGTITNTGLITLAGSGEKTLSGATTFNNTGSLTITGDGNLVLYEVNLLINNSGLIDFQSDADITSNFGISPKIISNTGTIIKSAGNDVSSISGQVINQATVDVQTGTLAFLSTIDHQAGAVIQGVGALDFPNGSGTFTNNGRFSPGNSPGILSVLDPLLLLPSTVIELELNGTTPGLEYDRLQVSGDLQMNGVLDVSLGFAPSAGDIFSVITAGSISVCNLPAQLILPFGGESYVFDVFCSATAVELQSAGVLPVELLDFYATAKNSQVELRWETAMEINNSGFEIHHSLDGLHWEALGFVESQGTSTASTAYLFWHEKPAKGWNYYRLKQIDWNGEFEYSSIVSVNMPTEGAAGISLFPNPARDYITIELPKEDGQLKLFNALGQLIYQQSGISLQERLPVDYLENGLYFLSWKLGDLFYQKSFVKQ